MAARHLRGLLAGTIGAVALLSAPVRAQDAQGGPAQQPKPAGAAQQGQQRAGTVQPQKAGGETAAQTPAGDAGLRKRVEQLEEQLVDLQVVIGTLESLARTGASSTGGAPPPRSHGLSAADSARLDSIETQVRALSLQLEQLAASAKGADAGRRSELPKAQGAPGVQFGGPQTGQDGAGVAGDEADPIGGLIQNGGLGEAPPAKTGEALPDLLAGRSGAPAAGGETVIAGTGEAQGPKQLYEAAYGQLLRQDYGAAQAGFIDFLRRYPKDPLAPDALYWLGETHYVQRNYADAAEAFDLVTASYAGSAKAPEAQLKRAMSLAQVGKREEACSALRQLGTKFPNARPVVKSKADAERQRVGCT